MFALAFGLVEKARATLQVQAQRPCICFFSLRISDFGGVGSRAWEFYPSGAFLKIKMPTRSRHFFQRLRAWGARLVRRLLVLVIVVEEGEIVIVVFDFTAIFERLAGAPLHNHAHQNRNHEACKHQDAHASE